MHVDRARPSAFLLGTADVFAARHLRIPFHIQHDRSLWQAGTTACRAIVNGTLTAQPTIVKLCIKSLAWFKNYSQQEVFYWLKVALRQLCGANKMGRKCGAECDKSRDCRHPKAETGIG